MTSSGLELVTGSEVIARAAVDAGCRFFAGYPITPASGILAAMTKLLPQVQGVVIEGEDEIASIGFCLGASATGMKVMTASSGPGLSLYSENIGFAQMAELPIVIVNVQRMGPATGAATTSAEGDIQFVRWVTSGGYPVIALCPSSLAESYSLTMECFNLAEKFRTPVFLMTCKELVMNQATVSASDYKAPLTLYRTVGKEPSLPYHYKEGSEVPPFLAMGGDLHSRVNTSIHDERGFLATDTLKKERALRHLSEKIESHRSELEYLKEDLEEGAKTLIIAYGLAARTARETVRQLRRRGKKVSLLVVHSLWPVAQNGIRKAAASCENIIVPEHNLGQYFSEIRSVLPDKKVQSVTRIDGKMITPEELMRCM
ncbi:MAG: pyruvate flavodoxin/ferredoxin oxidoreductase [Deltaproteobacteria bacterium]|nr:pyruvate flavodoxin/ferredoxin oxidoreductase [Deltaproteobacteria bacterium]MBI2501584.1 pyruvate flavodoxin/ferredoxin oxidoreductase [Deltaproteobacteria bacterium]